MTRLKYLIAALFAGTVALLVLAAAEHHAAERHRAAAAAIPVPVVPRAPAPLDATVTMSAADMLRALAAEGPETAPLLRSVEAAKGGEGEDRLVVTLSGTYGSVKRQTLRYAEALKGYHLSELNVSREGAADGQVTARLLLERARPEAAR